MSNFLVEWFKSCGMTPRDESAPTLDETYINRAGHMVTVSGRFFNLLEPDPGEIEIDEMAHHLSQINRFSGATPYPYSVAQHLLLCSNECLRRYPGRFDLGLACLLHDGAEYVCNDVIRPVKQLIGDCYRPIENKIQAAVWKRFGVELTSEAEAVIHEIDKAVVMTEALNLIHGSEKWDWGKTRPAHVEIIRTTPEFARAMFLQRFESLQRSLTARLYAHAE